MKVINSKLAAIGLAAFVFASCSDSSSDNGGGKNTPNVVDGTTIEIGNVASSTVANYKNSTANARKLLGSRAADETSFAGLTSMAEIPTPSGKAINGASDLDGGTWILDGKKAVDFSGKTIQNATIFIKGGSTFTYDNSKGNNAIYVLADAKLVFKGTSSAIADKDVVVVAKHGSFKSDNDITIDGTLFAADPIGALNKPKADDASTWTASQNITVNGKVYIDSRFTYTNSKTNESETIVPVLRAKTLTINADAKVNVKEKVSYTNDIVLNGALHVDKTAEVKNITINNGGELTSDGSVKASEALVMNAGATLTTNYLNVTGNAYTKEGKEIISVTPGNATATLNGDCKINIGKNGVINTNNLVTDNTEGQIVLKGAGSVAVVKADHFTSKASGIVNAFSTPESNQVYLIQFTKSTIGSTDVDSFDDVDLAASYLDYDVATEGKELVQGDNHTWSYNGNAVTEKPKLDLIANITPSSDGESASCIIPSGSALFVAYHTQGQNFGGKIEVASVSGDKISIDQTVAPTANKDYLYDFNHIMKDNSTLYVCGGSKIGSILGSFKLDGTTINTTEGMTEYTIDNKNKNNGYDANCIAKYNNNIVVAGTRGYEIFEPNLAFAHSYVAAPGKAKHLAVSGSNLIGLNYKSEVQAGDTPVEGEIQIFSNADLTTTVNKFNVGTIAPNNGKNTIAVDNGNIYVCKSAKGLMAYDAQGNELWKEAYVTPETKEKTDDAVDHRQGYINGVAVEGNYVYVAAGAYGVVVLNKADGTEVAHRAVGNQNSANYVAVDDQNNIYVAYGKGRIRVFKLTGTLK